MTTTAPSSAMVNALAGHLRALLQAASGFANSDATTEWAEPTANLRLSDSRVIAAAISAGAPKPKVRLGGPVISKVTLGTYPACTVRYELGVVEHPVTVGLWAWSAALRDDADYVIDQALNAPYWTTVSPVYTSTLATAARAGDRSIAPVSLADVLPGMRLQIGSGAGSDFVTVDGVTPTTLLLGAPLRAAHSSGAAVAEIVGRSSFCEDGLSLRLPLHFNTVARFDFEHRQTLDSPDNAQTQQWRSIRQGIARCREYRDVVGVVQGRMFLSGQVAPVDLGQFTPASPNPVSVRAF